VNIIRREGKNNFTKSPLPSELQIMTYSFPAFTFDTVYSSDSVEFCPEAGFEDILICGTYQVTKAEQDQNVDVSEQSSRNNKRLGRFYTFDVGGSSP
jgi:hypothetical protein